MTSLHMTIPSSCLRAGITGGIGSGKSTVCQIFQGLGVPIYYADIRAKWLMQYDEDLKKGIIGIFGPSAYTSEGQYDRPWVAQIAFSQPEKLAALNALVHPAVERDSRAWHEEQAMHGAAYTIKEAALMIESGSHLKLDVLLVVTAPEALRLERVMERDGLSAAQVQARIDSQLPETEKVRLADYVINNDGEHLLLPQVMEIHRQLQTRVETKRIES